MLGRALLRRPRDVQWLARELLAVVPAAVAGVEPHLIRARATFSTAELVTARLPLPGRTRGRWFRRAQDAAVRLTRLEHVRDQRVQGPSVGLGSGIHAP